jgi:acetyl/propionyl-CoA carboxylase alpha subunit
MLREHNEYRNGGINTSITFHQEMMDSTEFIWGTFDTGFLARRRVGRLNKPANDHEKVVAVAAALIAHEEGRQAVHIGGNQQEQVAAGVWKQAGRMRAVRGRW